MGSSISERLKEKISEKMYTQLSELHLLEEIEHACTTPALINLDFADYAEALQKKELIAYVNQNVDIECKELKIHRVSEEKPTKVILNIEGNGVSTTDLENCIRKVTDINGEIHVVFGVSHVEDMPRNALKVFALYTKQ